MQEKIVSLLRCPVTRTPLRLEKITSNHNHSFAAGEISDAILWASEDWFYPVIKGIPRLIPEAIIDYPDFLAQHIPDFEQRVNVLREKYRELIEGVIRKNKRTRESFALEWGLYDYEADKTWDADNTGKLNLIFRETDETPDSENGKWIFDAGCGNGQLDILLSKTGASRIAMDFSGSIERAAARNTSSQLNFIQGDIEFPPLIFDYFDIVHSSGVLHHTADTEKALASIETCVKKAGKLSVWLYHPRNNWSHHLFNRFRNWSSKWPLRAQYNFYLLTIFPASFIIKKMKGNPQNRREMMIDILDWFTPQFRWEHTPSAVFSWFFKRGYEDIRVTTREKFGFNMIGKKKS